MIQTENKIQQDIVLWFNNNYCLKHHSPRFIILSIPNDSINSIETKRKVNTGLLRGASDLIIVFPDRPLWIEVKTPTGSQSTDQKVFEERVKELGYQYELVRSLEQFQEVVNKAINRLKKG
ncbi:MAG: VRR-NUC domain-containing protein [Bacteroidota bacterium]